MNLSLVHDAARGKSLRSVASGCAVLVLALTACQGTFEAPRLNNPRDPANHALPATPAVNAVPQGCVSSTPRIRVTWTIDDATGVSGFQIYRAANPSEDPGTIIASVGPAETALVDGGLPGAPALQDETTYWYRVRALANGGIVGLRSDPDSATTASCP